MQAIVKATVWAAHLQFDETLPTINKQKHPKKGEYKEQNRKDPCPRRQMNHLKGRTTRVISSS